MAGPQPAERKMDPHVTQNLRFPLQLAMKTLLGFALAFLCSFAAAQDAAPDALIRQITDDVLSTVRADKALQAGNAAKLAALVQKDIVPHFDFPRATEMAVGPAWRRATPEQRDELTK